jgi:hypothetical protein
VHAAGGQQDICEDAVRLLMEMDEAAAMKKERGRAYFSKRGMGAKGLQQM